MSLFPSFRQGENGPQVKTTFGGFKDSDGVVLSGALLGATPADMSDAAFIDAVRAGGVVDKRRLRGKTATGGTKTKALPQLAGERAVHALAELFGVPVPAAADAVPAPVKNRGKTVPTANGTH